MSVFSELSVTGAHVALILLSAPVVALAQVTRAEVPVALVAPTIGQPLPKWQPGTLDIHQLSTGRGNSALVILPDGTTMLVDAGAAGDGIPDTDPHIDASRTPGEWIARYLQRHLPANNSALDYALLTHFHADHYGQITPQSPTSKLGNYRLSGITQVGDQLKIGTLIDRGWPDYSYPVPITDSTMTNYRRFLAAKRLTGTRIERAQPGSASQIRMMHDATKFPTVQLRTIIANGQTWTGQGSDTKALFTSVASLSANDFPNENMCSVGIKLTFGPFTFFTGGDLPGTADPGFPAWHSVEPLIANVVGHVDVHVVNQHGSMGEESEPYLRALSSNVLIIPSWAPSHPAPDVLKRIMNSRFAPADRYVFATDMRESTKIVIGQRANNLAAPPGNIIVRVDSNGSRYWVIVTSNRDETDNVIAVKGPFVVN